MVQYIYQYMNALADLTLEMAPYLLLGFLFAGILYGWFPKKKVYKYLGKPNSASVFNAALIGIPLPLCSCGVIPTGISFYNSGASKGSSVSFLISTPQTGVDSIMVTYSLLGLPMAIIKPIIALFTGFFGGFLTNRADKKEAVAQNTGDNQAVPEDVAEAENGAQDRSLKGMLHYAFVEFLEDIAKWLVIGLALAALIEVLVPESFFTSYLGNEYLEMLLIMVAAIPLYVCATGSVPIAAMLMLKGLSPGAAIVFLMAGPATNAATMTVIGNVFGRRTLILYLLSIIAGAYFFGIIVNEFLPREWFLNPLSQFHDMGHEHDLLPYWLKLGSGILLGGLILYALYNKYLSRYLKAKKMPEGKTQMSDNQNNNNLMSNNLLSNSQAGNSQLNIDQTNIKINIKSAADMNTEEIVVKGMTCNHCKATVENNVLALEGIESVDADIITEKVILQGKEINLDKVKERVESLGYRFEGTSH